MPGISGSGGVAKIVKRQQMTRAKRIALQRLKVVRAVPLIVQEFNNAFVTLSLDRVSPELIDRVNGLLELARLLTENERYANFGCYVDSIRVSADSDLVTLSARFGFNAPQWVKDTVRKLEL